ncbi:MAG: efflux RND transporter periplasmic adaptor subunit [Candidatus Eisenbacteria bacterium]|nr:efflux RND transporter periplasmic adaptor subunit [Candidatus Eisenbacteria bacterium]
MNRRRAVVLLGVIALGAVGVFFWQVSRKGAKPPSYRTEAVTRGDVRVQVSATGTLNAVTTVQVGSQVSGTISALHADFNDRVRSGQVLAQLDATFLRAQVLENRANLERTEVQYRQAVRDSARTFPLGARGLASQADLDQSQTAVESARAQVTSARAALQRAETNLRYATIQSPIDGVVVSRDVDVGQTVAASLSAPTLFTIAQDLTRMQLEAAVDEADIGQVKVGQTANFTVDAYPSRSFKGTVHQVRLAPETVQNVVTYTVIILVENDDLTLLPGMTANVTVDVDEARDVLKVPSTALRFRPDGGGPGGRPGTPGAGGERAGGPGEARGGGERRRAGERVFVLQGGRLRKVSVSPGLTDGSFTAIMSDSLREGDLVVVGRETATGPAQSDVVNPFAPRMGGGGGGNRQGRGGR